MFPTTTADVLEEVSKCPENEYFHVSNKNHGICSNNKIDDDAQYFDTPRKTTTVTCQLLLKTQNKLQEVRKNCRETCIRQSKKYLHQAKIIFVFKKLEKVIVLNSV